jgi:hypothetical protein
LAAGFRRLRYASAPANIHRASGAEEFAGKIFQRAYPGDLLSYISRRFEDLIFRYQNQISGCSERHIGIGRAH